MKRILLKSGEIFLILLLISIPLGYVFGVIRTEVLVNQYDKGLPLVTGFVLVPFMLIFTALLCYYCITSLTKIGGQVHSWRFGWREWGVGEGIVCFIVMLAPSLLFILGSVYTFLEVTGLTRMGMFTY